MSMTYAAIDVYYLNPDGSKEYIPNAEVKIYQASDDTLLDTVNADNNGVVLPGELAVALGTPIYYEYEEASVLYRGGQGVVTEFLYQDIIVADDPAQTTYPTGNIEPIAIEVMVKDSADPQAAWRLHARYAPTAMGSLPLALLEDRTIKIATVSIAPDGTRSVSEINHAPQTDVNYVAPVNAYATNFGDGSATSFTITHGLESDDLQVEFRLAAGTKESVSGIVWQPDAVDPLSKIVLATTVVPGVNELRVIIKK